MLPVHVNEVTRHARDSRESAPSRPPHGVTAVVLAGGDATDTLARAVGAPAKALVPLKGRPLGAYVLDALKGAAGVRRVVWVGASDADIRRRVDILVPGGPRLADSLALGVGAALPGLLDGERILLVTADVPWLRASSVDRFLADAGDAHDLVYPVVPRDVCEATFPDMHRTWIRLVGGEVTGGNLLLGRSEALLSLLPWVDRVVRARKAPWRMAALAGGDVLVRLATGRASLPHLESRLGTLLGHSVRALRCQDPALATDIDRPDHLPATLELADGAVRERPST